MNYDEYLLAYKNIILLNASKNGWSIYKSDDNNYYLYKQKTEKEIFNLEKDITILHKYPYDIKTILKKN